MKPIAAKKFDPKITYWGAMFLPIGIGRDGEWGPKVTFNGNVWSDYCRDASEKKEARIRRVVYWRTFDREKWGTSEEWLGPQEAYTSYQFTDCDGWSPEFPTLESAEKWLNEKHGLTLKIPI